MKTTEDYFNIAIGIFLIVVGLSAGVVLISMAYRILTD